MTTILTSIATMMTQARLQDGTSPGQMGVVTRGQGWAREIEVGSRKCDHQVGVIIEAGRLDGRPCADLTCRISP